MKKVSSKTLNTNSLPAASKLMPPAAVKMTKATSPAPKKMAKPSMKKK